MRLITKDEAIINSFPDLRKQNRLHKIIYRIMLIIGFVLILSTNRISNSNAIFGMIEIGYVKTLVTFVIVGVGWLLYRILGQIIFGKGFTALFYNRENIIRLIIAAVLYTNLQILFTNLPILFLPFTHFLTLGIHVYIYMKLSSLLSISSISDTLFLKRLNNIGELSVEIRNKREAHSQSAEVYAASPKYFLVEDIQGDIRFENVEFEMVDNRIKYKQFFSDAPKFRKKYLDELFIGYTTLDNYAVHDTESYGWVIYNNEVKHNIGRVYKIMSREQLKPKYLWTIGFWEYSLRSNSDPILNKNILL
jgi:hypothetical protein